MGRNNKRFSIDWYFGIGASHVRLAIVKISSLVFLGVRSTCQAEAMPDDEPSRMYTCEPHRIITNIRTMNK